MLVGAHYFPGWKDNPNHTSGGLWTKAWWWLANHPERTPLAPLGAYDESKQTVIDEHLRLANHGGVDYLMVNWYYNTTMRAPDADHAVELMMTSTVPGVKFAVSFETAAAVGGLNNLQDWLDVVDIWSRYFNSPRYLRVGGRPVVGITKLDNFLQTHAPRTGKTVKELLDIARDRVGGIYFLAMSAAIPFWTNAARSSGFDGFSVYNMSWQWLTKQSPTPGPRPTSFAELSANYLAESTWMLNNVSMDFWVPGTLGWDARAWPPGRLIGIPTAAECRQHLTDVRRLCESSPKCKGILLYAWNEHGEGGVLLPDKRDGWMKLNTLKRVMDR